MECRHFVLKMTFPVVFVQCLVLLPWAQNDSKSLMHTSWFVYLGQTLMQTSEAWIIILLCSLIKEHLRSIEFC